MADAQNKLQLQHAHAANALNYGHLGTATYVKHATQWAFLRGKGGGIIHPPSHATAAFPFELVGNDADAFESETSRDTADGGTQSDTASTHNALRCMPEFLGAIVQQQQRNTTTAQSHDSSIEPGLQPHQLAFGGAVAVSNNGKSSQTVPIAAIVSGSNFEAVRILLIGKESIQTTDVHEPLHNYQIPKITYDEDGHWTGEGDPVQQVCFAAVCDFETTQSAWMAARCRSATIIFHPLFYKTQVTPDDAASRLNPNPILRIPISRTGGYPHADVAFHPQDHKVLAIVDVRGNWTVWEIIVPRRSIASRVAFRVHLQSAGRLFTDTKLLSVHGDWHRVCWMSRTAHESDHLLVSSRLHAALFDSVGNNLGVLELSTGSTKDRQVVLDVAKSTTNPIHCYILTSTKLLLMSVAENYWTDSTDQQQMTMLLSWPHYRGRADHSLSLILAETAQATTILITSVNNDMITACRTGLFLEQSPTPVSLADPFHFEMPIIETMGDRAKSVRMLAFRNLQVRSRAGFAAGDEVPVLFKAFLGGPGFRLNELLYRCTDHVASGTFGQAHSSAIPLPVIRTLQRKSEKYIDLEDLGGFVVADEIKRWADNKSPDQPQFKDSEQNLDGMSADNIGTDWQDTYTGIVDSMGVSQNEVRPTEVALAIEGLQLQLENHEHHPITVRTLREILDLRTSLNDFEAAARAFTNFTTDFSRTMEQQLHISQLKVPGSRIHSDTASDIHDQLKANWILPLSHTIDNKTRLAKDRLTRSVAADLSLTSITIGPGPNIQAEAPQVQHRPFEDSALGSFPSSEPNATTSFSQGAAEDPACARLRRYGRLTKPIVPVSTSGVLTDMLAHLPPDVDSDPADYNWRLTEAHLAAEHSAEGAEKIDLKARRRAERLAASHRRQLQAQKQISQAVEQNLAPPIVMSSQYPATGEIQSSQVGPSNWDDHGTSIPVSMTQPARGTFGSRIAPTGKGQGARKSGRKQGF